MRLLIFLAGETGLEPAAYGFGDRCSTIELLPYIEFLLCDAINIIAYRQLLSRWNVFTG